MLMLPKKGDAVTTILGKLSGASTSENSSEALKKKNENAMEEISTEGKDEVNASSALEAASASVMSAFESKDSKALISGLRDIFNLFELEDDQVEGE